MADTYEVMGVTYSVATGQPISTVTNENTTKVEEVTKKKIVEPTTKDETNTNTDGSSDEDNIDTEYTVLVNGERIILYSDKWGASIQDKLEGHGIHIQRNGDIAVLSGKGGKGNACGGRLLINTKNGQLIKSGPVVQEITASKVNPGEGEGPKDNSDTGDAESKLLYGNGVEEVLGDKTIKAKHIVLDADTITLRGGTQIIVDTPEWVEELGMKTSKIDSVDEEVRAQKVSEISEDTSIGFDPRASKNIVSRGHINHRIMGDYAIKVDGYMDLQVMGNSFGVMLVKNRSAALTIGVNGVKNGGKFFVFTKGTFDLASGLTTGDLNLSTLGKFQTSSTLETKIEATTKVEVEAKTGVDIEATTGDVKIEAKAGNFDVDALKIYLN